MTEISPFEYVKSIDKKSEMLDDLSGYCPRVINRNYSLYPATLMSAQKMNLCGNLDYDLQYDFYYFGVPKGSRFGAWKNIKKTTEDDKDEKEKEEFFSRELHCSIKTLRSLGIFEFVK